MAEIQNQPEQRPVHRRRRKRRSRLPAILLSLVLAVGAALLLAVFVLRGATDMMGLNQEDREVDIIVEQGMSVSEITKLLADSDVVSQPGFFKIYLKLRAKDVTMQAGEYVLNCNMSYDQIISTLKTGDTTRNEIRLTFYEGMTMREIAEELEENSVCSADEFIEYVEGTDYEYEFYSLIPDNELRFRKMEGYLFPDTYDFYEGEMVASVAKKFLRAFQRNVYEPLYDEIRDAGMTLDDAVILASVIQKEASAEDEMATVSSVFHNRMENPSAGLPCLQSDVTINYVEDDIKVYQTRATEDIYAAYNTYKCEGLPAGPICSPGVAAIRAAIHPESTNYYFFVTDVNGTYYYSTTLDEHYNNVYKASRVGVNHGTDVT